MRIELTKQECLWLAALAKTEKENADALNEANPHRLFELRRDNMADLEKKLDAAVQRQIERGKKSVRDTLKQNVERSKAEFGNQPPTPKKSKDLER